MKVSFRFFDGDECMDAIPLLRQGLKFKSSKAQIQEVGSAEARICDISLPPVDKNTQRADKTVGVRRGKTQADVGTVIVADHLLQPRIHSFSGCFDFRNAA